VYGISITEAQIQAEVNRINNSTRAPEMLAEIKTALGNDPVKFSNTVAKPIIVERILRNKYNNDDTRHANTRKSAETIRGKLLSAKSIGSKTQETILENSAHHTSKAKWKMIPRPEETTKQPTPIPQTAPVKGTASGGRYSVESTVQVAQVLSSPEKDEGPDEQEFYFEDLHPDLQRVLNIQLQSTGDISAVIERPTGFQLFLLINRTEEEMEVTALTIQKHSYDEWLAEQSQ
jgi:hypothetical protein